MAYAESGINPLSDPTRAVRGFATLTDLTVTNVPLVDAYGAAFIPTVANIFGLKDIIMKNEGTVTAQFLLYCGVTQVAEWHTAPGTSLILSLNGIIPFNGLVNAQTSDPPCSVTVVGVQR